MDQTTVAQPSALDSFLGGLAGSATTLVNAYTQAEVNRINGPTEVSYQGGASASGGGNSMLMVGIGFAFVLVLILAKREKKD